MNTILNKVENCSGGTLPHFISKFNLTPILILEFVTQKFFKEERREGEREEGEREEGEREEV
jgi:hypothetical protein